jgi:voltage-gated potassium channel
MSTEIPSTATPRESSRALLGLLLALIVSFFVYPVLGQDILTRAVLDAYLMVVLVAMLFAVGRYRKLAFVALAIAILDYTADIAGYFYDVPALGGTRIALDLLFLSLALGVLLAGVLRSERVSAGKIYSAIAVYLLIGFNWAFVFDLLEFAQPGSFHLPSLNPTAGYEPYLRRYDPTNSIYFSFVTLTTLGFGEITPSTVLARTLVWLEAVTGQMYLAVLVARLVSLQIIHSGAAPDAEATSGPAPPTADPPEAAAPAATAPALAAVQAEWRELLAAQQRQIALLEEQVTLLRSAPPAAGPPRDGASSADAVGLAAADGEARVGPREG